MAQIGTSNLRIDSGREYVRVKFWAETPVFRKSLHAPKRFSARGGEPAFRHGSFGFEVSVKRFPPRGRRLRRANDMERP